MLASFAGCTFRTTGKACSEVASAKQRFWMCEPSDALGSSRALSWVSGSHGAWKVNTRTPFWYSCQQPPPDYQVYFCAVNTVNHGSQLEHNREKGGGPVLTDHHFISCLPTQWDQWLGAHKTMPSLPEWLAPRAGSQTNPSSSGFSEVFCYNKISNE